jgi:hypothetical protein
MIKKRESVSENTGCGLNFRGSEENPVIDFSEHGSKMSGFCNARRRLGVLPLYNRASANFHFV